MKKSVTFNQQSQIINIPTKNSTHTLTSVVQKNNQHRSYACIHTEIQQRRHESKKLAQKNILMLHQNLKVVQEVLKTLLPEDKDYVYFKDLGNDILFDMKLWMSKMNHYNDNKYVTQVIMQ
jgi:hypothetical protein